MRVARSRPNLAKPSTGGDGSWDGSWRWFSTEPPATAVEAES